MSPYKIPQHHKKLMPGHTLEQCYDLLAEAVNEMSGDCDERCNGGYHDDNCQALDSHFTIIQQQKRIAELEAEIDEIHATGGTSYTRLQKCQADNERLRAALKRTHGLIKQGRYQAADAELAALKGDES